MFHVRLLLSIAVSAMLASVSFASSIIDESRARPESVGMSSGKLEGIGGFLEEHVSSKQLAGAVVLVAKSGKVVCLESVGMRSLERNTPMHLDTLFRIHSMTKPIVSVAVMTLYEQGLLALDDPISKWLPEFKNMRVITEETSDISKSGYLTEPARRPITIRHLLSHTAGFPGNRFQERPERKDWVTSEAYQLRHRQRPYGTLRQMVKGIAKLPLDFHPGDFFDYGPSTDVLGRLAEVISGQPLDRLLRERILNPLGMGDTRFFIPTDEAARLCDFHRYDPEGGLSVVVDETSRWPVGLDRTYLSAQGGLVSTVEDYFRFLLMIRNGGIFEGKRILNSETVRLMGENQFVLMDIPQANIPNYISFGLGFGLLNERDHIQGPNGLNRNGSLFWLGAGGSRFFVDRKNDILFILLQQKSGKEHVDIRKRLENLIYQAIAD